MKLTYQGVYCLLATYRIMGEDRPTLFVISAPDDEPVHRAGFTDLEPNHWGKVFSDEEYQDLLTGTLGSGMKEILQTELAGGNEIKKIWIDRMEYQKEDHLWILLAKAFASPIRADLAGIHYTLTKNGTFWSSAYFDEDGRAVIACASSKKK